MRVADTIDQAWRKSKMFVVDQYIPAQPGMTLAILFTGRQSVCLEPIIAWLIPGSQKRMEASNAAASSLWPVTPSNQYLNLHAIVFPDQRVFEPGGEWHTDATAWVEAKAEQRRRRNATRGEAERRLVAKRVCSSD
jgi:hypothetical protein